MSTADEPPASDTGARHSRRIRELRQDPTETGFVALDQPAKVLGLSRSTIGAVLRGNHKCSTGLQATLIARLVTASKLPQARAAKAAFVDECGRALTLCITMAVEALRFLSDVVHQYRARRKDEWKKLAEELAEWEAMASEAEAQGESASKSVAIDSDAVSSFQLVSSPSEKPLSYLAEHRDNVAKKMTATQIAEAQKLVARMEAEAVMRLAISVDGTSPRNEKIKTKNAIDELSTWPQPRGGLRGFWAKATPSDETHRIQEWRRDAK